MIILLQLMGIALVWWLLGILGLILFQMPEWLSGEMEVALDRGDAGLALTGPIALIASTMRIVCIVISYVLRALRYLLRFISFPEEVIVLKRRTVRRPNHSSDSTL
jgi:hypothetical protein